MASSAESSGPSPASPTATPESPRPQAGPLPVKRGEIGFQEGLQSHNPRNSSSSTISPLPARHPADRDVPPSSRRSQRSNPAASSSTSLASSRNTAGGASSATTTGDAATDASSNNSMKKKRFFGLFKKGKVLAIGGLRLTTLLSFFLQLACIAGTIVTWVVTVKHLARPLSTVNGDNGPTNAIFIHVVFSVAALGQLLFLERRIYMLRAERYSYLHPGEILPFSRHPNMSDPVIAFSPWNRPPLPTYAAALAQSGAGTGDVEDHLIAAPPPPAYGNTRGSTLLLSGFLRDSLRAQRPPSAHTRSSRIGENSRPVSYASRDESRNSMQDETQRAQRVEETLARLERPSSRLATSS